MKNTKVFIYKGRVWDCWYTPLNDHWTAVSKDPDIKICVPSSWENLKEELTKVDTSKPRQDAVAVVDILPSLGAIQGI